MTGIGFLALIFKLITQRVGVAGAAVTAPSVSVSNLSYTVFHIAMLSVCTGSTVPGG